MRSSIAFASPRAEINVTPLVDVVLVLLIIFMVITPFLGDPFYVSIPRTSRAEAPSVRHLVTVSLDRGGSITLNGAPVLRADLEPRLAELFALGADRQVLFEGSDEATHKDAADIMDRIRNARGRVSIALPDAPHPVPLPPGEGADAGRR